MRPLLFHLTPLTLLATLGCGPEFASPSEIAGLRVLAVHQDPGSGSPGATVKLDMLLADQRIIGWTDPDPDPDPDPDAGPGAGPERSVTWFAGCHNPPGRQYFACLPAVRELALAASTGAIPPEELAGRVQMRTDTAATHFEFQLPDDILSAAPLVAHDPIHYGVSYVFFVVCAGTPGFDPSITEGLPVTCTTSDGKPVGPSGLVVGFTTIYTYDGVDNANPTMTSLDFDGEPMPVSTPSMPATCSSDAECNPSTYRHPRKCTTDTGTCAPVIGACSGGEDCPEIRVTPRIDTASVERFTDGYEVMWASYYATSGALSFSSRLVVDRAAGLAGDPSASWKIPGNVGTSRIWVTLNDQRGGADWAFFDVDVE